MDRGGPELEQVNRVRDRVPDRVDLDRVPDRDWTTGGAPILRDGEKRAVTQTLNPKP